MEALCAALYLDGGLAAAAAFVDRAVISQAGTLPTATEHPRVALTELVQARGETVEFRVVESRGPAHERVFTVEAHVAGRLLGAGSGPSKKEAAARASEAALASLRDAR
ncbi:MAG: hypothetical protein FDZ70_10050 [Actinobacteria bacterium]|nr:MAG: hypothetical protein FDZ70_10050 [Actinomycetota bacterium]